MGVIVVLAWALFVVMSVLTGGDVATGFTVVLGGVMAAVVDGATVCGGSGHAHNISRLEPPAADAATTVALSCRHRSSCHHCWRWRC